MPPGSVPQFLRRDFLTGTVAGVVASGSVGLAAGALAKPAFPEGVNPSYAQCGEDLVVSQIFEFLKIDRPTYLDVGAFLPIYSNNTYLFYQRGARGVLVEPNVDLVPELKRKRPKDVVLGVGIGITEAASAPYYCLTLAQWNTFSKDEAERLVAKSAGQVKIEKVVPLPLVPINRVIAEHFPGKGPDYLSIDVESLELAILQTLDFARFRPRVICSETLVALSLRNDPAVGEFLAGHGYEARGMTYANTVYIDKHLLSDVPSA
jgi:FkbM family methyltransferase